MSDLKECPKCREYAFFKTEHGCRLFQFKDKYWGDKWRDYYFIGDLEALAEKLCEDDYYSDPGDPQYVDFTVQVRDPLSGKEETYRVTAEACVSFSVTPLPSPGNDERANEERK